MDLKKIYILFLIIALFLILLNSAYSQSITIQPPVQPSNGPGGMDYNHSQVISYTYGSGALQYWIFEPASPKPQSAPVIVFNHGWGATDPIFYQAWINHLVKKGNIVIYPKYQSSIFDSSDNFTKNAIFSVKDALKRLNTGDHVRPQTDNLAIVGHSAGGLITINMASLATSEGLPAPKAIFCVEPGKSRSANDTMGPVLENLSKVPANALLLTLVGEDDSIVGFSDAKKIIQQTPQIPSENKDYVVMVSDQHGSSYLLADHISPLAIWNYNNSNILVNALDYYGTWKLFDGLYEASFYGKNRDYALGNTSKQRFMGIWSDGVPVKELIVMDI
jgi:dienelactone hydrolase